MVASRQSARRVELQLFRCIYGVPPRIVVLQVFLKPCHDGVYPFSALHWVHDTMVLSLHLNEGRRHAEQFQGCIHLNRLAQRHIGVGSTMSEEYGLSNLVGIVQRRPVYEEILACPGEAVGGRGLAVGISPVALSPVAGVALDACMRHAACKGVVLSHHILCHEAAVGCRDAAYMVGIALWHILHELPCGIYDVLCRSLSHGVHMP